jgi:chemotaxis protein methyltransferase CheR
MNADHAQDRPQPRQGVRGRKVLVDDDVRNIFALTSALEQKGAVVVIGRNGLEAIDRLNEVEDIDLVLMDVMMPEMDGFEATTEIRKDPRWRKLPIIAVTAKAMKDDQERCLQAGANDYLAKPIDLDRLFSLIRVVAEDGTHLVERQVTNSEIELRLLIEAIYLKYSYDFRDYSGASIKRRVSTLEPVRVRTISALQEKVLHDPTAFMQLLQLLTIPVSEMFPRSVALSGHPPGSGAAAQDLPVDQDLDRRLQHGEEVYSMAILLREEGLLERTIIYATDINPRSLEKAKQGIFSMENVRAYTANYQQAGGQRSFADYYTAAYGYAIFDKSLRENVTFADHSLATDSVFSETQLISCRNVLIYFNKNFRTGVRSVS